MNEPLIKIKMTWDEFGCCGCFFILMAALMVLLAQYQTSF